MSTNGEQKPWAGYVPPHWQPDVGASGSPAIDAAIQAAIDADAESRTDSVLIQSDPDLTAGGQSKKYGKERGAPSVKQLRGHLRHLEAEQQADIRATEPVRVKVERALSGEPSAGQRDLLSIMRAASPAQRNDYIGQATRGELPELAQAIAIAPTMLSGVTADTRAAFRDQVIKQTLSEADDAQFATLKHKKPARERATRYLNAVIAAHIAASDRDTLEAAGVVAKSVTQMTPEEKNALLNKPGGLAEYERRLADIA